MHDKVLQKIQNINQKIEDLKLEQQKLQAELENKIIQLLKNKDAFKIDFYTLYGAIVHTLEIIKDPDTTLQTIDSFKQIGVDLLDKKVQKKTDSPKKQL